MFEPGNSRRTALDPQTGIELRVGGTVEMTTLRAVTLFPDGRSVGFAFELEKNGEANSASGDFAICLLLGSLDFLAKFRNGTRTENTEFVRYILSGLSVIHQKWPFIDKGRFYSDRERYTEQQLKSLLSFDPPGETEIACL